MYRNLKGEMIKLNINADEIAEKLKIKPETVRRKINGKIGISYTQCVDVANLLSYKAKKAYGIDYLFKIDEKEQ